MSDPKNQIEDLEQEEAELTPEQTEAISGGASDYLLELDGIKGESKLTSTSLNFTNTTRSSP